jgi:Druantia protein DruA
MSEFQSSIVQAGREISIQELKHISQITEMFPSLKRTELAATICEHLAWETASGTPKVTACLNLLEKLEEEGRIRLPEKAPQKVRKSGHTGPRLTTRTDPEPLLRARLRDLEPVALDIVSESETKQLWKEYMERYHSLKYKEAFGHRLGYFVRSGTRLLGCVYMAGCAKSMGVRDDWIGWTPSQRNHNRPWIINNIRYLIFPWVEIPYLASHVLGKLAKRVASDWEHTYGFSPVLMETFVDPRHYAGTCYRAAGWELLGKTTGEGLRRPGRIYETTPKLLFVKPLHPDFRSLLCSDSLRGRRIT